MKPYSLFVLIFFMMIVLGINSVEAQEISEDISFGLRFYKSIDEIKDNKFDFAEYGENIQDNAVFGKCTILGRDSFLYISIDAEKGADVDIISYVSLHNATEYFEELCDEVSKKWGDPTDQWITDSDMTGDIYIMDRDIRSVIENRDDCRLVYMWKVEEHSAVLSACIENDEMEFFVNFMENSQ